MESRNLTLIRQGAKMISAMSEATVPKLTVIVRKAYGAGLYAMQIRRLNRIVSWPFPIPEYNEQK